ncbi:heme biosynthesis HemY N-terminal domain-containing protein [Candidatus Liberibacter asiaticus]
MILSILYFFLFAWILLFAVSRFFLSCPAMLFHMLHKRNYDKGYKALYTGLMSIAAHNIPLARKMHSYVSQQHTFHNEYLVYLLEVQIALAERQYNIAHEKLEMMLQIPATREFAVYSLYFESCRIGDLNSAQRYATKALDISPDAPWVTEAVVQQYVLAKEWSRAITFLNQKKKNAKEWNRNRAILLIARSLENADKGDMIASYHDAIESLKLCDNSIMASICAAKSLISQNKKRKAEVILEKIWKVNPHPEIANIYTHLLSENTVGKLKRALRLEEINKESVESLVIVSKIALEMGSIDQAHAKAMLAMKIAPRKEIFLLLAQIEQANSHNTDKILYWTQSALHAMPDPLWISDDGYLSSVWLPLSPISKTLCYFEWKIPTKSPEYISSENINFSLEMAYPADDLQSMLNNGKKNHLPSIKKVSSFEDSTIHPLDPHIRQPDDPGIKEQ